MNDDPKHWRQLAKEARAAAERQTDPNAQKELLQIAEGYEQLAMLMEQRGHSTST